MRILAIDLAYSGLTGWAVKDDSVIVPGQFTAYGQFSIGKGDIVYKITSLGERLSRLLYNDGRDSKWEPTIVAFEITDWHRTLRGSSDKVGYSIERKAQRCLGRAEAAMILASTQFMDGNGGYITKLIPIGANEAKREFLGGSGGSKIACARALSQEYPRFEFRDNKSYPLYDLSLKKKISNNVSDAFVIADVVAKREILNARMDS